MPQSTCAIVLLQHGARSGGGAEGVGGLWCAVCGVHIPSIGIVALLPETGSDGCALFLHHGPLVGNRLGRAHVADELLDCARAD